MLEKYSQTIVINSFSVRKNLLKKVTLKKKKKNCEGASHREGQPFSGVGFCKSVSSGGDPQAHLFPTKGVCKFGIISKWIIFWVWGNSQGFGNFEESLCQGILFDIKTWTWLKGCIYFTSWRYESFINILKDCKGT